MRFSTPCLIALPLFACIAACTTAAAQTPPATSSTTLKVTTQLTLENVTVTDSKGQPVHGLTQADFTIKEDGKPQPIRNFEEFDPARVALRPAPPLSPNVYSNRQPATIPSAINVLMLDNVTTGLMNGLHMSPEYFMYARQQSLKYLNDLPPGTRVAILELGDGLRVVQGLTSDKTLLLAAVNAISPKLVPMTYLPKPPPRSTLIEQCAASNKQSEFILDALNSVAAFVSGLQGKKNLIWFTPGAPWLTDYPAYVTVPCLVDHTQDLHKAYDLLTTAQVAVYPVDPRGLTIGNADADHDSLRDLADATGGTPYLNRNDLDKAVGEAIATGSDYYSLSYAPPASKYDGKHHSIEIKVDRPGLHLSYRQSYDAEDPLQLANASGDIFTVPAPMPNQSSLGPLMVRSVPTAIDLLFDVRVEAEPPPAEPPPLGALDPKLKKKTLTRYNLHYIIPANELTFADAPGGGHKSSLVMDIAAYDGDGNRITTLSQTTTLPLTSDAYKHLSDVTLRCLQQIDLPPGPVFLRVGMLDTATNKVGTLDIPLNIGKGTVAKK